MLDRRDIVNWLTDHGFETNDGFTFVAPIPEGTFEIELSDRTGRYALCKNGRRIQGKPTPYHVMNLDQVNDSLHGLGLYTLFMAETFVGGEPPIWFSQEVREALKPTTPSAGAAAPRLH
ncbi:hypothetical protein [Rhizobium sp. BK176]|uniref:hypothetical protein n=1 Tax=Rhizobium sp. BK176 TaxID=2587071 RepID=UPI00216A4DD0|nr:hypothetical protein [Rhizobium sp. BK176]MCS4089182.1 hypothetical protein [Rhizobium sp. BK176]